MKEWSGRQGWEFAVVRVAVPSIACFGSDGYHIWGLRRQQSMRCSDGEATTRSAGNCSGESDKGGKQPRGLNITKWLQPRKFAPL